MIPLVFSLLQSKLRYAGIYCRTSAPKAYVKLDLWVEARDHPST